MKFTIQTKGNHDIIDITDKIVEEGRESGVKDGLVLVSSAGSTCGITTIEYEPNLIEDFKEFLEKLAPKDKSYKHDQTWGEANAYSHLLSALIKPFLVVSIEEGKLILGQWQQIVFVDFDVRPRTRKVLVQIFAMS